MVGIKKILKIVGVSVALFPCIESISPAVSTAVTMFDNTSDGTFEFTTGIDAEIQFLLVPRSVFYTRVAPGFKIYFSDINRLNLTSRTSEFKSIYILFGGYASGFCPEKYLGPFYVNYWFGHPDMPAHEKKVLRYCQKEDVQEGLLGMRVKADGTIELVEGKYTKIIS